MTNRPENPFNNALSRRESLPLIVGGAFAALSSLEFFTAAQAFAQTEGSVANKPQDPTRLLPLGEAEQPVVGTRIGVSTDKELLGLQYHSRELLQGGLTKYTFPSKAEARPNMVITEQGGVARFKRIFIAGALGPNTYVDIPQFNSFYGPPESIAPPPKSDFWEKLIGLPSETQIFASQGFALVALKSNQEVYEIHVFNPTTVDQYLNTWAHVDKLQAQVSPDDSVFSILVVLDGLGSSLEENTPGLGVAFEPLRQNLHTFFDLTARYSYTGGRFTQMRDLPPFWNPNSYKPENTYQSIDRSAEFLKNMIDEIRGFRNKRKKIDIIGYSLGGVVALEFLKRDFKATSTSDYNDVEMSVLLLDAPVNGVAGAYITYFLRGRDFDTQLGNDAVNYLAALASSPQRQQDTIGLNINTARILRDKGVRLWCITNEDDCLVTPKSAIIPGFGYTLPLGRGANGIPNCDSLLLAPTLQGNDSTNVGHTQILTDPRARSTIKYFLENQQGRQPESPPPVIDQSPTPSTHQTDGPQPGHSYTYSSEEDVAQRRRGESVAQLIKKLPYNEANFSIQYSFEENKFIVTLNKDNTILANEELDKFLNENGIENRDWLYN